MHLYILTRGIKDRVDRWVEDMSAQYFPYQSKKKFPEAKDNWGHVQLAMRPIQLWEVVFPKDHLQDVMNMCWDSNPEMIWKYKPGLMVFKTMLGAKSIPKMEVKPRRIVRKQFVAPYPIGTKEDNDDENGNEDL